MTKSQKQILRDRVLRAQGTFNSVQLYGPLSIKSMRGDDFTARDRRKVLDEMLAEGLIEVVKQGTPETRERAGSSRLYRVVGIELD